jgi:dipeptidyl-peptidase 4
MRIPTILSALLILATSLISAPPEIPAYQKFMSPDSPQEVVAAKKADRIAWVDYAEGKRNAYTAAAPGFAPVRLTNFMKDDGIMMSEVKISDDGSTVVFLRGEAPNRSGWSPNPTADPDGPEPAIGAARTAGGKAWRVVDTANPELAPDGSSLLFIKDGQIYRAKLAPRRQPPLTAAKNPSSENGASKATRSFPLMAARSRSSPPESTTASSWCTTSLLAL